MTRKTWMIQPIAEAPAEQELTDHQLGFCVLAFYSGHIAMALFFCQFIHLSIPYNTIHESRQINQRQLATATHSLLNLSSSSSFAGFFFILSKGRYLAIKDLSISSRLSE